jgi:hypothetical protein
VTGTERLWSLPVRQLAEDATVQSDETWRAELRFSQNQVDQLFELGVTQRPRVTERDASLPPGVSSTGNARFLTGEIDRGAGVGMEVLVRGLEAAVEASLRELRARNVEAGADSDQVKERAEGHREEDAGPRVMTSEEAAAQWHDLRSRGEPWERVVLTEGGRRVAPIAGDWWRLHQHRGTTLDGAYWGDWHTGEFNASGYERDILRVLAPRDACISQGVDERDDGDGDEPAG